MDGTRFATPSAAWVTRESTLDACTALFAMTAAWDMLSCVNRPDAWAMPKPNSGSSWASLTRLYLPASGPDVTLYRSKTTFADSREAWGASYCDAMAARAPDVIAASGKPAMRAAPAFSGSSFNARARLYVPSLFLYGANWSRALLTVAGPSLTCNACCSLRGFGGGRSSRGSKPVGCSPRKAAEPDMR